MSFIRKCADDDHDNYYLVHVMTNTCQQHVHCYQVAQTLKKTGTQQHSSQINYKSPTMSMPVSHIKKLKFTILPYRSFQLYISLQKSPSALI